jgi:hypothetical protein
MAACKTSRFLIHEGNKMESIIEKNSIDFLQIDYCKSKNKIKDYIMLRD